MKGRRVIETASLVCPSWATPGRRATDMRWEVRGADSKTGKDLTLSLEARDAAEAERLASYNGVFVTAVTLEVAPARRNTTALEYQTPSSMMPAPTMPVPPPPTRAVTSASLGPIADRERTFYTDAQVHVTNARLIIAGKTYTMANITSVEATRIAPSNGGVLWSVILGVIFSFFGILVVGDRYSAGAGWFMLLLGAFLFVVAYFISKGLTSSYSLRIASTSGEVDALRDESSSRIETITAAINEAIVSRQ